MTYDLALLDSHVERGLLTRRERDDLCIFNYTNHCVYEGAWDDVTKAARGLILNRHTGEVVALPFPKFFNHGERGVEVPIPDRKPDTVTVKMDGSLGISFRDESGRLMWSTRGTFDSEQAEVAQDMWDARYAHVEVPEEWTLLAEIVHPDTRNIVDYGDMAELIILGIRNRITGEDLSHADVSAWCGSVGLHVVDRVDLDYAAAAELAEKMDDQEEGFVLRWGDYRVKVKSRAYLSLARLLSGLNDRRIADLWYAGITADDLPALPEEHRDAIAAAYIDLDNEVIEAISLTSAWVRDLDGLPMAVVAERVKHTPLRPLVFSELRGCPTSFRKFVYKRRFQGDPRPTELNEYGGFSRIQTHKEEG